MNILLAYCFSLAGIAAVLCLTQVGRCRVAPSTANALRTGACVDKACACYTATFPHLIQPLVLALLPPHAIAYRQLQRYYR